MEQVENATATFLTSRDAGDLVAYGNRVRALPAVLGPRRIIVAMKFLLPALDGALSPEVQKVEVLSPKLVCNVVMV
jgi:hypothetical protein